MKTKVVKVDNTFVVEVSEEDRKRNYEVTDEFCDLFAEYIARAVRKKLSVRTTRKDVHLNSSR